LRKLQFVPVQRISISIRRSLWRRLMPFLSLATIWSILFLPGSVFLRAQAIPQGVSQGLQERPQAAPQEVPQVPQKVLQEVRGVWMTVNDSEVWMNRDRMHQAVDELARSNFNTIYPVVWNSGYVMYPSPFAQKAGIQSFIPLGKQKQDTLAELIAYAHQRRLRVIPWMEFGFMTPPTSELAMLHPNWLTQKKDGTQTDDESVGEVVWLNPFRPEVQQFFSGLVTEVASRYDVDGIQFDDHTSLPSKFGYDPYTLDLYAKDAEKAKEAEKARAIEKAKNIQKAKKQVKQEATELKETKEVKTPMATDPKVSEWVKWRANKLTDYIVQLQQTVKTIRPKVVFSVAPNPYDTAYLGSLQDWLAWVRKGIVDELLVQVYRTDFNSFIAQVNRPELQEAKKKISTGIGVLTGLRNRQIPMAQIQAQTKYVRSQGLGVTFFYFESLWDYAPESIQQRQTQFQALLLPASVQADNP
jgi:uncharacterized lipoprotein YddW (UPF0748 family)